MSQERSEGDLRNTGLSLKHDREWDYELDRIVEAVDERDAETVGLQFPEGLKRRGPAVADDLRRELPDDVTVMISGQPCYGACDLDTYMMRRTDVFVHFGHSPMKESEKIIYVPLFSNVEVTPIMEEALDELAAPGEDPDVGLVTTAQHMNKFE
ncbi:MAG: diphthamide synthesis protein, partial [Haloarculaceae archaeon]